MRSIFWFLLVICPFLVCSCGLKGPLYLPVENPDDKKVFLVNQADVDTDAPLSAEQLVQSNEPMVIEKEISDKGKTENIIIESDEVEVK